MKKFQKSAMRSTFTFRQDTCKILFLVIFAAISSIANAEDNKNKPPSRLETIFYCEEKAPGYSVTTTKQILGLFSQYGSSHLNEDHPGYKAMPGYFCKIQKTLITDPETLSKAQLTVEAWGFRYYSVPVDKKTRAGAIEIAPN